MDSFEFTLLYLKMWLRDLRYKFFLEHSFMNWFKELSMNANNIKMYFFLEMKYDFLLDIFSFKFNFTRMFFLSGADFILPPMPPMRAFSSGAETYYFKFQERHI